MTTISTDYSSKCNILNDIWMKERDNYFFEDFIPAHDLGFPLAYFICHGIVDKTIRAQEIIDVTFTNPVRTV